MKSLSQIKADNKEAPAEIAAAKRLPDVFIIYEQIGVNGIPKPRGTQFAEDDAKEACSLMILFQEVVLGSIVDSEK